MATSPRVGCSGWNYKAWRGSFYPKELAVARWLAFYASRLDTVEINNTFYRLPERLTFAAWHAQAPDGFLFAVKASRFLTHMKRLRQPEEPLARLFSRASALGRRLGPVLYQLPRTFPIDVPRLDAFLQALPRLSGGRRIRHVMEFRHPSWYVTEVYQVLRAHGVALCLHDKEGSAIDRPMDGPFVYVRFHGTSGRYHGSYSSRALHRWAHRLAEQAQSGRPVFAVLQQRPGSRRGRERADAPFGAQEPAASDVTEADVRRGALGVTSCRSRSPESPSPLGGWRRRRQASRARHADPRESAPPVPCRSAWRRPPRRRLPE